MAEQGQHLKGQIWQRMVQAVRTFLRSLGFSVLFSQRDILEMLRKAEAHVGMKAPETRSPEFKKWFGDWELSAQAAVSRTADTFGTARIQATKFVGKPLTNKSTKLVAVVSNSSLNKMLNEKAVGKSESPSLHSFAVANADQMFERAEVAWQKPDDKGDPNIRAIHRFFAPVNVNGKMMLAKLTVKETSDEATANRLYSVESVEFNEKSPAAQWVAASAAADGIDLTSTRSARDVLSLAQRVQDFNPATVSKVVDADGKPLVVYRGERTDFGNMPTGATYFAENPRWANRFAGKSSGANVIPAYLAIANPLDLTSFGETPISKELLQAFLSGKGVVLDFSDAGGPMPVYEFVRRWGFAKAVLDAGFDGVKQMEGRGEGRRATSLDTVAWLSFKPTQIKSATGNNGDFDGTNPDIRFSRGPVAAARDTLAAARELNLAAGYKLGDLLKFSSKTGWWDRTVGTQFNLAQRNKEFKRVYDGVQTFLSDVSIFTRLSTANRLSG